MEVADAVLTPASLKTQRRQDQKPRASPLPPFAFFASTNELSTRSLRTSHGSEGRVPSPGACIEDGQFIAAKHPFRRGSVLCVSQSEPFAGLVPPRRHYSPSATQYTHEQNPAHAPRGIISSSPPPPGPTPDGTDTIAPFPSTTQTVPRLGPQAPLRFRFRWRYRSRYRRVRQGQPTGLLVIPRRVDPAP